jgi:glucuronokinase
MSSAAPAAAVAERPLPAKAASHAAAAAPAVVVAVAGAAAPAAPTTTAAAAAAAKAQAAPPPTPITSRVHARVGLLGNPSDGFGGKTISFSLANFWAEATLTPLPRGAGVRFAPHPVHDAPAHASVAALRRRVEGQGYYGGLRLLTATVKRFAEECERRGIPLRRPDDDDDDDAAGGGAGVATTQEEEGEQAGDFELAYDSNIPRQAGLSGSSGIVCAALNCLLRYYRVPGEALPLRDRPELVLSAERELGITAGLQDRVIQVYGGLVYMDFGRGGGGAEAAEAGAGAAAAPAKGAAAAPAYERLGPALLPRLWLIYADNPSDSGRVHADVRARWDRGDAAVREGMAQVAALAAEGRRALEASDAPALARLMDRNFDLRRAIFGDAALGAENLRMVATARSVGAAAKFTGSGGAVVAFCPQGEAQEEALREACAAAGFVAVRAEVGAENHL